MTENIKEKSLDAQQLGSAEYNSPEVTAQPTKQTEQLIDDLADKLIQILQQALTEKDKRISELEVKIKYLEQSNKDLDYLLNDKKNKPQQLTQISGTLTSNLRTRKSTDVPYMAFLRLEWEYETRNNEQHSLEECETTKCKDCEIPVIFKMQKYSFLTESHLKYYGRDPLWIKPHLKKGDKVILEGTWAKSDHSNRPSFTCYNYQVLKGDSK